MNKFFCFLLSMILSCVAIKSDAQIQADISIIAGRLTAGSLSGTIKNATVSYFINQNWDSTVGRWTDINYAIVSPQPGFHTDSFFLRLDYLSTAYAKSGGTYYHSAAVMNVINKAYAYFVANITMFNNGAGGWFQYIGYPGDICTSILLVQGQMDSAIQSKVVSYIKSLATSSYYKTNWNTGANLAWVSDWKLSAGCILKDSSIIANAVNSVASLMAITSGTNDGLKVDYAYFQHYMIYNGGYSACLIPDVINYPSYIKGTAFNTTFPTSVLGDYLLNGEYWFQFHGFGDIVPQGREFSKPGMTTYVGVTNLSTMKSNDPTRAIQYQAYINNQSNKGPFTQSGTKHFFTSDMMVHRDSTSYISVKIPSSRNYLFEIGNYQDLKGYNLGYGFTQILNSGNEYNNIEPIWNWSRLPGTTTPLDTLYLNSNAQTKGAFYSPKGTNPLGGGLSDSANGIMAFTATYNGVTATKSYFFLGNAMVCLGSGITSTYAGNTVTSVNQTNSSGTVTVEKVGGKSSPYYGTQTPYGNNLLWTHHNNVGYYFPPQNANIVIKNDFQTGNWYDINHTDQTNVNQKVFSIWFDHGIKPIDSSYQYIVVPNIAEANFESWVTSGNPYTVLSNTKNIQCVKNSVLNLYGIAFYSSGTIILDNGVTVSTNKAAIVLINGAMTPGNLIKVSVSDPNYVANNKITITLKQNLSKALVMIMPTGNYLGSTISTSFLADALLPVSLNKLTAKTQDKSVILSWSTASEINNKGFAIERSGDNNTWTEVDFVDAESVTTNYQFTDKSPIIGNNYYRLKQEDKDGNSRYSSVVSIKMEASLPSHLISIYPNPSNNSTNIQLGSITDAHPYIQLVSSDGRIILSKALNNTMSNSLISLDLSGVSKGVYLLKLTHGSTIETQKLIIN